MYTCCTGLGSKKLTFSLTDDSDDAHYYIMEAFPKLKDAGGYELLRSSSGCLLDVIPTPPECYSVTYLKDVVYTTGKHLYSSYPEMPLSGSNTL